MNKLPIQAGLALLAALCLALAIAPDLEAKTRRGTLESYALHISASVKRHLKLPPEWRKRAYEATARIDLDRGGRVTGASITAPSGNAAFDAAVLAAINKTGGFGPPPFELYAVGLRFSSKM